MPQDKPPGFLPSPRLTAIAIVAGLIAGAAAVYVSGGFEGNTSPEIAVVVPSASAQSDADLKCEAKAAKAAEIGKSATGQVAAMAVADPIRSMSSLAFNGPDGKPMTIADRAGKAVLVNLWATWCAPCRAEMPELDELQKELGGDTFEVMAINVDTGDDTKPKKFLEETNVASLAYYRENSLKLFNGLKSQGLALGLPVTLLVDAEGCLMASMNGPAAWASDDAKRLVESAVAAN